MRLLKTLKMPMCWLALLVGSVAHAVPSLSTSFPSLTPQSRSLDELSVSVGEESFLNRESPPKHHADSTRLSTRLRTRSDGKPIGGLLEIGASFDTAVEKQTSFEVPEAHLLWTPHESRQRVFAGRKRESWSELDSYWTLGLSQPLNRFDSLRPSEQGLTGIFGEFNWDNAQLILFGSAIYIPEQGPNYELQDGKFHTNNAWFSEPADRVVLVSKGTPLRYRIETPTVGSVIQHASGGFIFRTGGPQGFRTQTSYVKKPRNQLSLPFQGVLVTDSLNPEASVTIFPQVAYHNLASLEFSHHAKTSAFRLSGLADISDSERIAPGLTWQTYEPLYLVSPSVDFQLGSGENYVPWIRLGTLHSIGGEATLVSKGSVKPEQNPFGARTMYRQAASLEWRGRFARVKGWSVEHGLRWIEEFSERGSVLMTDLRLATRENWQFGIYADFLASRLPEDENPGFISRFRGNDRVGALLTYVF